MDNKKLSLALKKLKENTPKKKFNQSIDLIINLKNLNLKNPDDQIEFFMQLHNSKGKKIGGKRVYEENWTGRRRRYGLRQDRRP